MKPIPPAEVDDASLAAVVAYVRSIGSTGGSGPPAASKPIATTPTVVAGAAPPTGPAVAGTPTPTPRASPAIENTVGAAVFRWGCYDCHPGGRQGRGPSLIGLSADTIASVVRDGSVEMPPYSVAVVSDRELADLIAYIRSLR